MRRPSPSAVLYVLGSVLYVAAAVLLLPPYIGTRFAASIALFVAGSVLYVLAAILDLRGAVTAARRRSATEAGALSQPLRGVAPESSWRPLRCAEEYESLTCCVLYAFGGLLFLAGSVLYLPTLGLDNAGTLTFRAGSCAYISGSACGAVRALQAPRQGQPPPQWNALGLSALAQFVCGSSLFIMGGAEFQSGRARAGAIAWLVGSIAFLTGSVTSAVAAGFKDPPSAEEVVAAEAGCDEVEEL